MTKHTLARYRQGYLELWAKAKVTKTVAADAAANKILKLRERYVAIERLTGVPWFMIAVIHMRENNCNFRGVLHNGELIVGTGKKTTLVPKGRGPFATFEEAAVDALKDYKAAVWDVAQLAFKLEAFNGFGYRNKGIPSPYLWGGSSVQMRGKYVRDGVYDPNTMDSQLGAMTVLRRLCDLSSEVAERVNGKSAPVVLPDPPDVPAPEPTEGGFWAAILSALLAIFKRKG